MYVGIYGKIMIKVIKDIIDNQISLIHNNNNNIYKWCNKHGYNYIKCGMIEYNYNYFNMINALIKILMMILMMILIIIKLIKIIISLNILMNNYFHI